MAGARFTRRRLIGSAAAGAVALQAPWGFPDLAWPAGEPGGDGWDDAAYWAFADRTQALVDDLWSEARGSYLGGGAGRHLLQRRPALHARRRGAGGTPGDRPATTTARACWPGGCASPRRGASLPGSGPGSDQTHLYGWGCSLEGYGGQHVVVDTAVVRGLAQAWSRPRRARAPAGDGRVAIRDRVARCAYSTSTRTRRCV